MDLRPETGARIAAALSAVLMASATFAPSTASACSCMQARPRRQLSVVDGATDFPVDGVIRVFLDAFPEPLRAPLASEYRLRDASGALVPLRASVVATRLDLTPQRALRPGASYTLEQVFAFDASGVAVDDAGRARARGALRGAYYPVATFRTAVAPGAARPLAPTVTRARLHFAYGGGDCGPATAISVSISLPPGVRDDDVLELHVRGQGVVASAPATRTSLSAGDMLCDPDPVQLRPGAWLDAQVELRSASGASLGASPWVRASGSGTGTRPLPPARARSRFMSWPALTSIATPRAAPPTGPTGCPHGLEARAFTEATPVGAPAFYGARPALGTDGTRAWLAYAGGAAPSPMQLFRVDGSASQPVPTTVDGSPEAMLGASGGPLLVAARHVSGQAHARVVGLTTGGAARFETDLAVRGDTFRLTAGASSVLAIWSQIHPGYSATLGYAVIDPQTGALAHPAAITPHGLDSNAEGGAAAWVDGHFLVVWPSGSGLSRRGPLRAATLAAGGGALSAAVTVPVETYAPPDLVGAGSRAGLVTGTADGRILWSLLDGSGQVVAGPTHVSLGVGGRDNRLPRIAWNGSLFAVAWETFPSPGLYAVVVDVSGAASAPQRIDHAEAALGYVGLVPSPHGFIAAYTADSGRGVVTTLSCRSTPALGPPPRIAPAP